MPMVRAGAVNLHYEEHGDGEGVIVFIHGNLGCANWMDLVWSHLSGDRRVVAIEWRGCGDSDKPAPDADYANYSMVQHARDMLAAIRSLGVSRCDLCGHSTGGIIAVHMLLMEPERFGKVLLLDPVGPMGLKFGPEHHALFSQMKADVDVMARILATAMPTLFEPQASQSDGTVFSNSATAEQRQLFEVLVEKTRVLSDGIWFGTLENLTKEWNSGELRAKQESIPHEILVLWGMLDQWIPREDMDEMAARIRNCRIELVPGVGHSMTVEQPALFAGYFNNFFLQPEATSASTACLR